MNIGIIAHNNKRSTLEDFCIAYKRTLGKHHLYATGITGRRIEEIVGLKVTGFLPGSMGGDKQFIEAIESGELDAVIFFYNPNISSPKEPDVMEIIQYCDKHCIPIATNLGMAEVLIMGIEAGDMEYVGLKGVR